MAIHWIVILFYLLLFLFSDMMRKKEWIPMVLL